MSADDETIDAVAHQGRQRAQQAVPPKFYNVGEVQRAREALHAIPPDIGRDDWVRAGMAAQAAGLGFDDFDGWSQGGESYNGRDCADVWRSFRGDGIRAGTLFHMAEQFGWHQNGNSPARRMRGAHAHPETTTADAAAVWSQCAPAPEAHPYIRAKHGTSEGLRIVPDAGARTIRGFSLAGWLVVPAYAAAATAATPQSLQFIPPPGAGKKLNLPGAPMRGACFTVGTRAAGDVAYLCEGIGQAWACHRATGKAAIVCFGWGNVATVAAKLSGPLVLVPDVGKEAAAERVADDTGARVAALPEGESQNFDVGDFAARDGIEALACVLAGAKAPARPEPVPLVTATTPEPYPLDALPVGIREAVNEVQGFVQAPLPLVASSALGALSLAGQSLADVKRADKLRGPCSLYLLTVADSGERKSTCDGFFTDAIRDFEVERADAAKPKWKAYRADSAAWESRQAGVKDALRAASKKGASTSDLQSELEALEDVKPEAPRVPKLIRGDETPEHLALALAKDWPAGGVMSAEAGVVLGAHGMGKDTVMRNLALLNILWDGGSLSIGRKTSESFDVHGARLTVALQVQEATLRAFFEQAGALARGSGFLARFLIAWPASTQGHRPFKEAPQQWPALAAFNERIAALLRMPQPLTPEWTLEPPLVAFAPDAHAAWVQFHDAIESELGASGELHDVRDVASKIADNAARLAALFHLYTGEAGAISAGCFTGASRVAAWHLSEARRFFGELALPPEVADAVRLERWLVDYCREHAGQSVPRREAQRAGPVRDANRLADALDALVDANRARLVAEGKRKLIELHPDLLREVAP